MGFHTFPVERADALEDAVSRYRYLSAEELLWLLDPSPTDVIADFGSGTGFYIDDVAPYAGTVHAIDIQEAMHDVYREKGVPENVELVTARIDDLPFATGSLDGAFSTMTYHEFATPEAIEEIARVLTEGAPLAIADWTAAGEGEHGPSLSERFALADAEAALAEHFALEHAFERRETFVVRAHRL